MPTSICILWKSLNVNVALDCKAPGSKVPSPLDTKDVWTNNNIPSQVAVYTYSNLYNSYALLQYCHLMLLQTISKKNLFI